VDDCTPPLRLRSAPPKCLNNGTCVDRVGGYRCNCPPGFTGERCEGDINECLSNPCSTSNSLDCIQLPNDYQCGCKPGFTGRKCQSRFSVCESQPCQSGGVCSVSGNSALGYTCTCQLVSTHSHYGFKHRIKCFSLCNSAFFYLSLSACITSILRVMLGSIVNEACPVGSCPATTEGTVRSPRGARGAPACPVTAGPSVSITAMKAALPSPAGMEGRALRRPASPSSNAGVPVAG